MFQFFEYVGAFFDSILTIIKNIFNGLIMLVQLLSSVPFSLSCFLSPKIPFLSFRRYAKALCMVWPNTVLFHFARDYRFIISIP